MAGAKAAGDAERQGWGRKAGAGSDDRRLERSFNLLLFCFGVTTNQKHTERPFSCDYYSLSHEAVFQDDLEWRYCTSPVGGETGCYQL